MAVFCFPQLSIDHLWLRLNLVVALPSGAMMGWGGGGGGGGNEKKTR